MSVEGVVIVDKPAGWTSHDVVAKMRGIAGTKRTGHLGTLDPLATGVLPIMIGQVTRLARFWDHAEKSYEAVIRFGWATDTYDREGEATTPVSDVRPTADSIEAFLASKRGEIEQTPPPVSAKKINGVPAYKLARNNAPVELKPVKITIHELTLKELTEDRATVFMRCSAGSYVRSIAHEMGQALGCGAHIDQLRRTRSGPFAIDKAHTLDALQTGLAQAVIAPSDLLPQFGTVHVDENLTRLIRQGRDFAASPFRNNADSEYVKAVDHAGSLIAIGKAILPNLYHPEIVFA